MHTLVRAACTGRHRDCCTTEEQTTCACTSSRRGLALNQHSRWRARLESRRVGQRGLHGLRKVLPGAVVAVLPMPGRAPRRARAARGRAAAAAAARAAAVEARHRRRGQVQGQGGALPRGRLPGRLAVLAARPVAAGPPPQRALRLERLHDRVHRAAAFRVLRRVSRVQRGVCRRAVVVGMRRGGGRVGMVAARWPVLRMPGLQRLPDGLLRAMRAPVGLVQGFAGCCVLAVTLVLDTAVRPGLPLPCGFPVPRSLPGCRDIRMRIALFVAFHLRRRALPAAVRLRILLPRVVPLLCIALPVAVGRCFPGFPVRTGLPLRAVSVPPAVAATLAPAAARRRAGRAARRRGALRGGAAGRRAAGALVSRCRAILRVARRGRRRRARPGAQRARGCGASGARRAAKLRPQPLLLVPAHLLPQLRVAALRRAGAAVSARACRCAMQSPCPAAQCAWLEAAPAQGGVGRHGLRRPGDRALVGCRLLQQQRVGARETLWTGAATCSSTTWRRRRSVARRPRASRARAPRRSSSSAASSASTCVGIELDLAYWRGRGGSPNPAMSGGRMRLRQARAGPRRGGSACGVGAGQRGSGHADPRCN